MKYRLLPIAFFVTAGLNGQTSREAYRQAYDTWRQIHNDLERDAATGGPAQVAQADRAAAAAASFGATHAAYLKSFIEDATQRRQVLQTTATLPSPDLAPPAVAALVSAELQTVTRTIARFANDQDRGIQQLRQSLERERVALAGLNDAIEARQKTVATTSEAVAALDQTRTRTVQAFGEQASRLSGTVAQLETERVAWADYYEKLAQAIQIANAPPPPVSIAPAPPRASITPVPLPRYVGEWVYPVVNGIFHGAQPESVELTVREQNGHAEGTLLGRFKLSPGSATDPTVRFEFKGDFGPTTNQRFTLVTSDGTPGTLELIPGPAFNLLEVNFQTDPQGNKIRTGNFILVKK